MKELKKFSVVLAIAVLVALFFIVIWIYNITSDHGNKINTLWMATGSTAEILSANAKEREDLQKGLLELGQSFKESQQSKKTNFVNIFDALKSVEGAIKKSDNTYTLPSAAKLVGEGKQRKKVKYESDSDDYSESTDSEIEAELRRRKKRRS